MEEIDEEEVKNGSYVDRKAVGIKMGAKVNAPWEEGATVQNGERRSNLYSRGMNKH